MSFPVKETELTMHIHVSLCRLQKGFTTATLW